MSSFSIIVQGAPYSSQAASSALNFSKAALESGHSIYRVFFYQDGAHNASSLVVPPQDEINLPKSWQALINTHKLDAVVCIASALKRGIVDANETDRYALPASNILEGFTIGGLGLWLDATLNSDRVLNFAP
ncbi:MAG: sulfurtransferase complex subunit TusD [Pseudomonadota bacterium]